MRPALAALPLLLLGLPAAALDFACRFDVECYDTEACAPTDFEVTFGTLDDRWLMSSIAGERAFFEIADEDGSIAFMSPNTNGTVGLLTLLSDNTVVYTEQALFTPSYSVTYRGACVEGL